MRLLLDTHAFLWFIDDSPMLSTTGKSLLEAENELLLSVGSLWEIAVKLRLGKLTVAMPTEALMTQHLTANTLTSYPSPSHISFRYRHFLCIIGIHLIG